MNEQTTFWTKASRDAALDEMQEFRSRMGGRYASGRNFDRGAGRHTGVSCLSPYVRRRLVLEEELVDTALATHGLDGAEKFIQEVFWRGYFKGWLERRPSVWQAYQDGLSQDLFALDDDLKLARRVREAEEGRTSLECFDAWVEELVSTGYLHNHARMWFASIWIFTLRLPWRLGADFFYRNLLDGDPASNTLSWRWVAGLHTRGKFYQAQAWNIAKFTNQRFAPRDRDLADVIEGLQGTEPDGLPGVMPLRSLTAYDPARPTALLLTEEDCHPESWALTLPSECYVATLTASHLRSERPVAEHVLRFEAEALADTAQRLAKIPDMLTARDPRDLLKWAKGCEVSQIVTGYIPEGPLGDWMRGAGGLLQSEGIALVEVRRRWDDAIWPHATAGFFKVKKQIPRILRDLELEDRQPRLL
ncbi:MAG: FAD-binding domain-containing protein [Pseudomonadota bacterium]